MHKCTKRCGESYALWSWRNCKPTQGSNRFSELRQICKLSCSGWLGISYICRCFIAVFHMPVLFHRLCCHQRHMSKQHATNALKSSRIQNGPIPRLCFTHGEEIYLCPSSYSISVRIVCNHYLLHHINWKLIYVVSDEKAFLRNVAWTWAHLCRQWWKKSYLMSRVGSNKTMHQYSAYEM